MSPYLCHQARIQDSPQGWAEGDERGPIRDLKAQLPAGSKGRAKTPEAESLSSIFIKKEGPKVKDLSDISPL